VESNVVVIEMAKLTCGEMFYLWKIIEVQMCFITINICFQFKRLCELCFCVKGGPIHS
jgi:hypothetical protein